MTQPTVRLPDGAKAIWISESNEPAPSEVAEVDDRIPAKVAVRRMKAGEHLLWTGDFHNGRQLLKAVQKRLTSRENPAPTLAGRWQQERARAVREAQILGRLVIRVEADGSVALRRAQDTTEAVAWAWGPSEGPRLLAFRTLIGAMGAAGWRRNGLPVHGLNGLIRPHYGVFSPTRQVYVALLDEVEDVAGARVLDAGCGTGVLAFVLLQRGAATAVGTDMDLRAVDCAMANAAELGLSERFQALQCDLFPEGETFDRVVFNGPWMPGVPSTRLDRAIFDTEGQTLKRWLAELPAHLKPGGEGWLIVSDLPERMGLRPEGALSQLFAEAGLEVVGVYTKPARHGRAKESQDPLHRARAGEKVSLYRLAAQPVR